MHLFKQVFFNHWKFLKLLYETNNRIKVATKYQEIKQKYFILDTLKKQKNK